MAIIPAGSVRYSNVPIYKAGPTAWAHDDREFTNRDIARLVTHTQAAMKAGSLNIPLIIGHNENTGEKPSMGMIVAIRKATKVFENPITHKRERIATVLADMVLSPEMNKLYKAGKYPALSVEIHQNHVLPTAPGGKQTIFPFVIKALAFLGGSAPAHGMDFSATAEAIRPAALFAHDMDHEGSVFMYRVNSKIKTEGDMPAEPKGKQFAEEDIMAAVQAIADIVNPLLEAGLEDEPPAEDAEAEAAVEQNAAPEGDTPAVSEGVQGQINGLAQSLQEISAAVKGLAEGFKAGESKEKEEAFAALQGRIPRNVFDANVETQGLEATKIMFSATPVTPPAGQAPGAGTTETQHKAQIVAMRAEIKGSQNGFYKGKSDAFIDRVAADRLQMAAMNGSN